MKKKVVECKSVAVPMQDNEKDMITGWKNNEKHLSPLKISRDGGRFKFQTISNRGSDQDKKDLINAGACFATGAKSSTFGTMLLNSCLSAGGLKLDKMKKNEAEEVLNAILDTLHSLKPSDEIEGMLITRLISINFLISNSMNLSVIENQSIDGQELYINRYSKLMRLFNETLETLMRYKRKGEQKVIVQHVNVNDGGRAVVGNFEAGGVGKNLGGTP